MKKGKISLVVAFILGLLILLFFIMGPTNMINKLASPFTKFQLFNNSVELKNGILPFTQFVNQYKTCKILPSDNCLCLFNTFVLPSNSFIQIDKKESKDGRPITIFNYYQGTVGSFGKVNYQSYLGGCIENIKARTPPIKLGEEYLNCDEGSQFIVDYDFLSTPAADSPWWASVASRDSFLRGNYIIDNPQNPGKKMLDTNYIGYSSTERLYLTFYKTDTLSSTDKTLLTPLKLISSTGEYNLQFLYKKNVPDYSLSRIYFIPTPSFLLSRITQTDEKIVEGIKSIGICTQPEGVDPAIKILASIKEAIDYCLKENKIGMTTCKSVSTKLPSNYKIYLSNTVLKEISLYLENKWLDSKSPSKVSSLRLIKNVEDTGGDSSFKFVIDSSQESTNINQLALYYCPDNTVCILPQLANDQEYVYSEAKEPTTPKPAVQKSQDEIDLENAKASITEIKLKIEACTKKQYSGSKILCDAVTPTFPTRYYTKIGVSDFVIFKQALVGTSSTSFSDDKIPYSGYNIWPYYTEQPDTFTDLKIDKKGTVTIMSGKKYEIYLCGTNSVCIFKVSN